MEDNLFTLKAAVCAFFTTLGAFLGWKGILLLSWVAVMALDYLSGTAAAAKDHKWSSSVARAGLWHKAGMVLSVLVALIADLALTVAARYIPMGIQWPGILMPLVLAWYIVTELGSILENAVKLGARVPQWLVKMLEASANVIDKVGEKEPEKKAGENLDPPEA